MKISEMIQKKTKKPKGLILHENNDIVVIATLESKNAKTGNMIQIWILVKYVSPIEAVKTGADIANCGDCKHRHFLGGACYVNVGHAPRAIWKAYKEGKYPHKDINYLRYFAGAAVRFGAYGDPSYIPLDIVQDICGVARRWTGYTHQWQRCETEYMNYFMASVDNKKEHVIALENKFRSFKVVQEDYVLDTNELVCPSDTHGVKCIDCGLCNGAGQAKDIVILVHGTRKAKFSA